MQSSILMFLSTGKGFISTLHRDSPFSYSSKLTPFCSRVLCIYACLPIKVTVAQGG